MEPQIWTFQEQIVTITGLLCSVRKIVEVHIHPLHLFIHNMQKSGLIKNC